jgi:hypothetical protein
MDYWSTNDPAQIRSFFNALGSRTGQFDFSGWQHATDAEFTRNLTYNDETNKFYTSYGTVENGEVVIVGRSFDADFTPVSFDGLGYEGAFVYRPRSGIGGVMESIDRFLNGSGKYLTYNDGITNWSVNFSGRITGVAPINGLTIGYPPAVGRGGKISTKGMPHGDGGRSLTSADKKIVELQKQLKTATKAEQKVINKKIQNIREDAQRKRSGETHWRR